MPTIAELNDAFRKSIPNGRAYFTRGVIATFKDLTPVVQQVRTYSDFSPDNDPYGEHDFGVFYISNHKLFWKIDVYADESLTFGADDPASAEAVRVLTVMLAEEY